jgi:hypothetical protein
MSADVLTDAEVSALREAIASAVLSTPEGLGERLDDDPAAYLRLVSATRTAAEETSRLLRESIDGARAAGHSWDTIGRLLGVSRQAAQQRFGTAATDPSSSAAAVEAGSGPRRRILSPLTAFDEMAVLEAEGRRGWHSVGFGTLYHEVEESPWQWEHRRVLVVAGAHRRLEEQGWSRIGAMWFPWAYYSRRLDVPAEPDAA